MTEHYRNYSLEDIEGEEWKDIDIGGFEELYQISNMGRVKLYPRWSRNGLHSKCLKKERILKSAKSGLKTDGNNYVHVHIVDLNHHGKTIRVHRLVAMYFVDNPENKPEVNHKNGIRWDNRAENLEWVTSSENKFHSYRTGMHIPIKSENCGKAKLTRQQANEIRAKYIPFKYTLEMLGNEYGVKDCTIYNIIKNISWK